MKHPVEVLCNLQVLEFIKKFPDAGAGERSRRQAVEKIRANVEWVEQYRDDIANWLYSNIALSH